MRAALFVILTYLVCCDVWAYVDLGVNYSFTQSRVDGVDTAGTGDDPGQAVATTRSWTANWGWYIWEYTALELNYSESEERVVDNRVATNDSSTFSILKMDSLVKTQVTGVGLRQSFAKRKAFFIPSLAVGYAKFTSFGKTTYLVDNAGVQEETTLDREREVSSSSYVTFQLRIRLTQLMGLSLAAKSVMPDFDTSKAGDNLTYSAGFSWVF